MLPGTSFLGSVIMNAYAKEILGKKTHGRVLNIGAGNQSVTYRFDRRLANAEYHTLDVTPENQPTMLAMREICRWFPRSRMIGCWRLQCSSM